MTDHELVGGQRLIKVHNPDQCLGEWCCIHNPSDHHMVTWRQNWRPDRRIMERMCVHDIGHPDPDDPKTSDEYEAVHGCDGCCIAPVMDNKTFIKPFNGKDTVHYADKPTSFKPTKLSRKEKLLEIASMVSNDDCYCDFDSSHICNHVVENTHNINVTNVPSMPIVYPTVHTTDTSPAILSTQILSTPIVSPPASALRSTPIPGDIADDEMVEFERAKQDTITITISRATAEGVVHDLPEASADFAFGRVALACRAALEGER